MRMLVTGSSGHLGEALVRTLRARGIDVTGLDIRPSEWTTVVGSITETDTAREVMAGSFFPESDDTPDAHEETLRRQHQGRRIRVTAGGARRMSSTRTCWLRSERHDSVFGGTSSRPPRRCGEKTYRS